MKPQTFFDHFERLTDAPNAVPRLREMILQLAVQGKLVAQDEQDEPASMLLEKIKAEKTRLVKEKKIGVDESLPTIEASNEPFRLPNRWQWVYLNQITNTVHYGYTASANHSLKDVRLLRITDIQNGKVDWDSVPGCEIDKEKINGVELRDGDLLIARTGGTIGKSFLVENVSVRAVFASYLIRAVPNKFLFPKYLKLFLESELYWGQLYAKSMGTGQPNVNATSLKSLFVPLPPFEEQKRIVAKVDELMRLCDVLEQEQAEQRDTRSHLNRAALDQLLAARDAAEFRTRWQTVCNHFTTLTATPDLLGKLRQTVLQLAVQGKFTRQDPQDEPAPALLRRIRAEKERLVKEKRLKRADPLPPVNPDETSFALPSGWTWARLGQLGITQTGTTPPTSNAAFFGNEFPFVKPADITSSSINYDKEGLSELGAEKGKLVPAGSVLMVCIGGSIGKVGMVDRDCSCNQQINYVTLHADMLPQLFYYFLKSPYFQDQVLSLAPSTTLPILSKGKWDLIALPLPPLEEQKRIVAVVNHLMALCDELEAGLRRAEEDGERLLSAAVRSLLASVSENSSAEAVALAVQLKQ
jgi:type I restriction enzyme S subunit